MPNNIHGSNYYCDEYHDLRQSRIKREKASPKKNMVHSLPVSLDIMLASTRFLLPFSMWNRPISPIYLKEDVSNSCSRTLFSMTSSIPLICSRVLRVSSIFFCSDMRSWYICLLSCCKSESALALASVAVVYDTFDFVMGSLWVNSKLWDFLYSLLVWVPSMACSFLFLLSLNSMKSLKVLAIVLNRLYRQSAIFLRCSFSVVVQNLICPTTSLSQLILVLMESCSIFIYLSNQLRCWSVNAAQEQAAFEKQFS